MPGQCLESVFSVLEIKLLFVGLEMRLGSRGGFWNRLNHAAYFVNRTISTEEKHFLKLLLFLCWQQSSELSFFSQAFRRNS